MISKKIFILLCTCILLGFVSTAQGNETYTFCDGIFNTLSFEEIALLSKNKSQNNCINEKVKYVLTTPIVDNSMPLKEPFKVKNSLTIASWNIDRGYGVEEITNIFNCPDKYISRIKTKNNKTITKVKEQIALLKTADIIVLNEVDAGMPRTQYKIIVEELARKLQYNYAYGVEFIEVDPTHLGLEDYQWSEERFLQDKNLSEVDKEKYKGLHGNAILSKYPISNARIIRLPDGYDWYDDEKRKILPKETIRRLAAKTFLNEHIFREIRIGSRMALLADITLPKKGATFTVVSTHLENKTLPKNRKKQIDHILNNLKECKNYVILAGDMNTSSYDTRPINNSKTNLCKSLCKAPINIVIKPVNFIIGTYRRYSDPTVKGIPIIATNKERAIFESIKSNEFSDGQKFDCSGNKEFANTNERCKKGFKPTFTFKRHYWVGKYKFDWIFVKSSTNQGYYLSEDKYNPATNCARTLYELNYSMEHPPSRHAPIVLQIKI